MRCSDLRPDPLPAVGLLLPGGGSSSSSMAYYFQLLPTTQPTQLRITTSCSPTSGATRRSSPAVRSAITTPSSPSWATCCPTSSPSLRPPMAGASTSTAATCALRSVSGYHSPSRPPYFLLLTYTLNCAPVHLPTCPPTRHLRTKAGLLLLLLLLVLPTAAVVTRRALRLRARPPPKMG